MHPLSEIYVVQKVPWPRGYTRSALSTIWSSLILRKKGVNNSSAKNMRGGRMKGIHETGKKEGGGKIAG